ncbi:MAG: response regulator transcription factor, partial [Pseudomonadota bacterium]
YAPKSAEPPILLAALQLCLNGGVYVPPLVLSALSESRDSPSLGANAQARPQSEALSTLTPRQWDVLRLLTNGSSNKVIARALELSEGTVKIHVASILRALDVQNRAEAVNRAIRLGLT